MYSGCLKTEVGMCAYRDLITSINLLNINDLQYVYIIVFVLFMINRGLFYQTG